MVVDVVRIMIELNDVVTNGNTFRERELNVPFLFEVRALDGDEAWVKPLNGNYVNQGRYTFNIEHLTLVEKHNVA